MTPSTDDDLAGAALPRHGDGVQPEAAGPLDHDVVAHADAGQVEPAGDLGHRAVDARPAAHPEVVRRLEDGVVGIQVEVVAERALEVRRLVAGLGQVTGALRAGPVLPLQAGPAAAAGEEVGEDDPVADRQRLAVRVGRDALAERRDPAGPLVPEVARQRPPALRVVDVAAPGVQVGAADVGEADLDQRRARPRLRHRVLLDLDRLAGGVERRRSSGRRHHPSARVIRSRPILAVILVSQDACRPDNREAVRRI